MDADERFERFESFVAAFYRDCGWEDPRVDGDARTAVAFNVTIDDVAFSIGYDPQAGDACLFLWCVLGDAPSHNEAAMLRRLLERNVEIARDHGASACIDSHTGQVALYKRRTVDAFEVASVREDLTRLARLAVQWRRDGFMDGPAQAPWMESLEAPPPWQMRA